MIALFLFAVLVLIIAAQLLPLDDRITFALQLAIIAIAIICLLGFR